ncbi:hypothetical protein GH733_006569 [Mirounga leonina]|nr:hypothetical protein GH733_006569 [Mirounga leonina]
MVGAGGACGSGPERCLAGSERPREVCLGCGAAGTQLRAICRPEMSGSASLRPPPDCSFCGGSCPRVTAGRPVRTYQPDEYKNGSVYYLKTVSRPENGIKDLVVLFSSFTVQSSVEFSHHQLAVSMPGQNPGMEKMLSNRYHDDRSVWLLEERACIRTVRQPSGPGWQEVKDAINTGSPCGEWKACNDEKSLPPSAYLERRRGSLLQFCLCVCRPVAGGWGGVVTPAPPHASPGARIPKDLRGVLEDVEILYDNIETVLCRISKIPPGWPSFKKHPYLTPSGIRILGIALLLASSLSLPLSGLVSRQQEDSDSWFAPLSTEGSGSRTSEGGSLHLSLASRLHCCSAEQEARGTVLRKSLWQEHRVQVSLSSPGSDLGCGDMAEPTKVSKYRTRYNAFLRKMLEKTEMKKLTQGVLLNPTYSAYPVEFAHISVTRAGDQSRKHITGQNGNPVHKFLLNHSSSWSLYCP